MKDYYVAVSDITFYLYDEDGNAKTDKSGNEITYRLKDGIRFKPLEYIADGVEIDMLGTPYYWAGGGGGCGFANPTAINPINIIENKYIII